MNISHRIKPEEVSNLEAEIVVIFRASNQTYIDKLKEQMDYLLNKNMWGIVSGFFPNLYLVPYGEHSKRYAPLCQEGDVVGVFLNTEEFEDEENGVMENFE